MPFRPAFRSLFRLILTCLVLAGLLAPPAGMVTAAPAQAIVLSVDIVAVQANQSVTLRLKEFPVRTNFTVKMARVGKKAADGQVIAEFNTEKGGTFEATYEIPEELKGQLILAIRFDSPDRYSADTWFFNRDQLRKPAPGDTRPEIQFSDVKQNTSFAFTAANLVPNASYSVRVGPHYTFFRDYVSLPALRADENGVLNATLELPARAKNAEVILLRLDGGGTYVTGSFSNADGGAALAPAQLVKVINCTLLHILPLPELEPGQEFDATWRVQNTSNRDWSADDLLYRYSSGVKMHKYADFQPVGWTVKKGWSFNITIDMTAPKQAGWHRTEWTLLLDDQPGELALCKLPIAVFVKEK